MSVRRGLLYAGLLALVGLLADVAVASAADSGYRGSDFFGQLFGPPPLGGVSTRSPDSRSTLDWYIDTSHDVAGIPVAPDVQGTIASMAAFVSNLLWSGTRLLTRFADGFFT